jgi:DNA-binding NarL/FixJ family response regulator
VRCDGDCARALGVAAVLPKPVSREHLIAAVRDLLERGR